MLLATAPATSPVTIEAPPGQADATIGAGHVFATPGLGLLVICTGPVPLGQRPQVVGDSAVQAMPSSSGCRT